ncbi:MAG: type II secretion system protein GspI [Thalassolituus sp.]|uniref:type II secretion system minor pseudopilin GspI n=1 Tax=Thalassolituus sp. TaxID=2030822 RepID=UPI00351317A3|nr:MAG: type II secretion system protein GspI [Thalassolituus sp.]
MSNQRGFTLLEVMVAVTIFAAVAVTITDTSSMRVNNLLSMHTSTLASFVAENRLAEIRLTGIVPAAGDSKDTVRMADQEWYLYTHVEDTQFPGMRRIEVSVAPEQNKENPVVTLATVMGSR